MSRTLSQTAVASAFAPQTTEVWHVLLTISGGTIPAAQRYVNNAADVTGGAANALFTAWPFEVGMITDRDDRPPELTLRIDNVDQTLIALLRAQISPIDVKTEIVLSSTPTVVEASYDFKLREIRYNAEIIEATLSFEPMLDEAFPKHTLSPTDFPALYTHYEAEGYGEPVDKHAGSGRLKSTTRKKEGG